MNYWKYRAFNEALTVSEGIIIGPSGDKDKSLHAIIIKLRQQGLQVIDIQPATRIEYIQESTLNKLKRRLVR